MATRKAAKQAVKRQPNRKKATAIKKKARAVGAPKRKKKSRSRRDELSEGIIAGAIDDNRSKLPLQIAQFADALAGNNSKAVERFLKEGLPVNQNVVVNYSPLMIATALGNHAIVKLLLDNGAAVDTAPVLLLCTGEPTRVKLLLRAGADPNASDGVHTPLGRAIERSERGVVDLLIKAGATVGKRERAIAQRVRDPKIDKLLGIEPAPQKLQIPPFLSKAFKDGFRKAFKLTGARPTGLGGHGLKLFVCRVDPDRFLSDKESKQYGAQEKATRKAAAALFDSVEGCEFAASNVDGDVVVLLESKNKFYFLQKPKPLLQWLREFDAVHNLRWSSMYDGRLVYLIDKKPTSAQISKWKSRWTRAGLDEITLKISPTELVVDFDS